MIRLVEGAARQKTPNEIALNILLASLSIVFVIVCLTMQPIAGLVGATVSVPVLIALLVCLIPTTIGALLSAIGIAGMDRLVQHNVLAMSGRAVEAAGDITTLLLDKTGTITYGNRRASRVVPIAGVTEPDLLAAAALSSAADGTPEGRSIVELAAAAGVTTGLPAVPPRSPSPHRRACPASTDRRHPGPQGCRRRPAGLGRHREPGDRRRGRRDLGRGRHPAGRRPPDP